MAVAIPVGARADDASFKELARTAETFFKATGDEVGKSFSDELAKGMASGEKAVRDAARKVADSFDKVADATGRARIIQEQWNKAQESGSTEKIVRETERLATAQRAASRATRQTINEFKDYEKAAADAGRASSSAFGSGFSTGLGRSHVVRFFNDLRADAQSSGSMAGVIAGRAMGAALTASLAAATAGVAAVVGGIGYALTQGFQRYEAIDAAKHRLDNLNVTLRATGKATFDVAQVMKTADEVVQQTPFKLTESFALATTALASPTGDLRRFLTDVADTAGFTQQSLADVGQAFLKVANSGKLTAEELNNEFRNLPLSAWLSETLGKAPAEITKMISDGQIGLEYLLRTIEQHASGFAKAAGDTIQGALENMQTAVARVGAKFLGALFGEPTDDANTFKEAIDVVTDRINRLGVWVDAHQGEIKRLFDDGVRAAEALTGAIGWVIDKINVIPGGILTVVGAFAAWETIKGVAALIESLTAVNTLLGVALPASAASGAAAIAAALGPVAALVGTIAAGVAGVGLLGGMAYLSVAWDDVEKQAREYDRMQERLGAGESPESVYGVPEPTEGGFLFGNEGPTLTPGPTPDNWLFAGGGENVIEAGPPPGPPEGAVAGIGGGPAGSPILTPPGMAGAAAGGGGGRGGGKSSSPPPYFDPSLWSLASRPVPGTSVGFSSDERILSARERVEEARLRLLELEGKDNVAQSALVSAKNNVLQAERALREAETAATTAHEKTLKDHTSTMEQLGAQIDNDFGISKGLPGIAENLTKFIANLAFAPVFGALSGVVAASGGSAGQGSGLLGLFAGRSPGGGAGVGVGSTSGVGAALAAAGAPAGMADAISLAKAANGRPYSFGGAGDAIHNFLYDCSGFMSDIYNALTGQTPGVRRFTTRSDFSQLGFLPGFDPNSVFNIGVNPEHMAGTLGGVNVESGGAAGRTQFGGSAAGALSPQFAQQWHLPNAMIAGMGAGVGLPPGAGADWLAMAQAESGGNWQTNTGNGFYGGLQFAQPSWEGAGGLAYAPRADLASPAQQMAVGENLLRQQGPGAWPNTFAPPTGVGGGGLRIPGGVAGPLAPTGRRPGPAAPRGLAPTTEGGPGFGISGGGLIGLAEQAPIAAMEGAASGASFFGSGAASGAAAAVAGQAAQIGIDELNRGIGFLGQEAAVGVNGLLQTVFPRESPLADVSTSWFGKIASGLAGARPATTNLAGLADANMAGMSDEMPPNPDRVNQPGAGQNGEPGQPNGPVNNNTQITVKNYAANEQGNGRDVAAAWHAQQQYSHAGGRK